MDLRLFTSCSRPPPIRFRPRPNPPHRLFLPVLPSCFAAALRPPLPSQARLIPPRASAATADSDPDGGDVRDPISEASGAADFESAGSGLAALSADFSSVPSSIWKQMMEILVFFGPAIGIWISSPLMGLIDTMVIGQGSSLELAAMGPGTVFCDNLCYIFMFLSVATSNMIATSLAKKDKRLAQRQISILLFIAFVCGLGMLSITKLPGTRVLSAFVGSANLHIVPAANSYIQIRSYAWPAHLVGMVAQSASLAMKDPWGPLKALAVATAINGFGDIFLCRVCGYGIAGAAWATMFSQVVSAFIMVDNLNKSGFRTFSVSIPSLGEFLQIFAISLPVCITMASKIVFYSLLVYSATAMGTTTIAAHQVMINTFCTCTVFGEPLSQTAQSFMPELLYGVSRSLDKARMLLKSLFTTGAITGLLLGIAGTSVPWRFPHIFTTDNMIIGEMHKILLPYFVALVVTPPTHCLEGTLLAGRDFKYLCVSMSTCLCAAALLLMLLNRQGFGLAACWWALVGFQWARFLLALQRLLSRRGMLYNEECYSQNESAKLHDT